MLIVEADEDSRLLLRLLFEISGFGVAECHEGARVVGEVARLRPVLILLNEWLPRVDGRTVCQRLRGADESIRHTPVIFISSSADATSARLAFEAGCTLYFIKPFDIGELKAAATELVTGLVRPLIHVERMPPGFETTL